MLRPPIHAALVFSAFFLCVAGCDDAASLTVEQADAAADASASLDERGLETPISDAQSVAIDAIDAAAWPSVSGDWLLFGDEDPITALLHGDRGLITGTMCFWGGLPGPCPDSGGTNGSQDGRHVVFDSGEPSPATPANPYRIQFDGWISADGSRMSGDVLFAASKVRYPLAWLRLPDGVSYPKRDRSRDLPILGTSTLRLSRAVIDHGEFDSQRSYQFIALSETQIHGDFGAFYCTERNLGLDTDPTIDVGDGRSASAITMGPVPVTSDSLPTKLVIGVIEGKVEVLQVTMPSGGVYLFRP